MRPAEKSAWRSPASAARDINARLSSVSSAALAGQINRRQRDLRARMTLSRCLSYRLAPTFDRPQRQAGGNKYHPGQIAQRRFPPPRGALNQARATSALLLDKLSVETECAYQVGSFYAPFFCRPAQPFNRRRWVASEFHAVRNRVADKDFAAATSRVAADFSQRSATWPRARLQQ